MSRGELHVVLHEGTGSSAGTPYLALLGGWTGGGGRPSRPEEEVRGQFRWEVENVYSRIRKMGMGQDLDEHFRGEMINRI